MRSALNGVVTPKCVCVLQVRPVIVDNLRHYCRAKLLFACQRHGLLMCTYMGPELGVFFGGTFVEDSINPRMRVG